MTLKRENFSDRLFFQFLNVYLCDYSNNEIQFIFQCIFEKFACSKLRQYSGEVVGGLIGLFNKVARVFLPLPSK